MPSATRCFREIKKAIPGDWVLSRNDSGFDWIIECDSGDYYFMMLHGDYVYDFHVFFNGRSTITDDDPVFVDFFECLAAFKERISAATKIEEEW